MGCFKSVLDKLTDVHQKMGNMPSFRSNNKKLEVAKDPPSRNNDSLLPDWMEDVRVPMDYSQGYGRIIKDEKEIEELKKGIRYNKKTRFIEQEEKEILHQGLHMTQKYYHKKISKRSAENKVLKVGKDGAWLLRNGERRPGTLFVVYYYDKNVYHKQIKVASFNDQYTRSSRYVVSTDLNVAFHDVHSLLQFYRLNTGGEFKCKLGESIKDPEQPDDSPPRFNVRPLSIEKKSTSSVKSAFSSFRSKKSSEKSPPKTQPDKPEN